MRHPCPEDTESVPSFVRAISPHLFKVTVGSTEHWWSYYTAYCSVHSAAICALQAQWPPPPKKKCEPRRGPHIHHWEHTASDLSKSCPQL